MKKTISIIGSKGLTNTLLDLNQIEDRISSGNRKLSETLRKLDNVPNISEVKRHWYGTVDIDSIERGLYQVYDILCEYVKECGEAVRTTNENLSSALDLIKALAILDKELFDRIDKGDTSVNEFKAAFREWAKQNNVKNEDVDKLFEICFQRNYTLRDRINDVKQDVAKLGNDYDKIYKEINALRVFVANEKIETLKQINDSFKKKEYELSAKQNELKNGLLTEYESHIQALNRFSINLKNDAHKYEKVLNDLFSKYEAFSKHTEQKAEKMADSLKDRHDEYIADINSLGEKYSKELTFLKAESQKDFELQLKEQQGLFDEVLENVKKTSLRQFFLGIVLGAIVTYGLNYILNIL